MRYHARSRRVLLREACTLALLSSALTNVAGCSPFGSAAPAAADGRGIADAFLKEIRDGRVEAAWRSTSAEFKSMLGLEGLKTFVKKHPVTQKSAEFERYEAVDRNGLSMAECSYRSATPPARLKVLLASEPDGTWKVERFSVE